MSEQWLSIVEYARVNSISDMTVRRRIKNGKIRAVLRDGKYYIPAEKSVNAKGASNSYEALNQNNSIETHEPIKTPINRGYVNHTTQYENSSRTVASHAETRNLNPSHFEPKKPYTPVVNQNLNPNQYPHVPNEVKHQVFHKGQVTVEAARLLEFCESVLKNSESTEYRLRNQYKSQLDALEAKNKAKDLQILRLNQQVEDLQLLVDIIDRNKS